MDAQAKVDFRRRAIERIKEIDDELLRLGVRRERTDFKMFTTDEVVEYGKCKRRQLDQRRKFLGEEKVKEMLGK